MNYKRVLMFVIPSIILIVIILAILGIKISFIINSELEVQTIVPSSTVYATNGDTLSLKFETEVDAHTTCSTICSFTLREVSSNETLFQERRKVDSSITYMIPYFLDDSFTGTSYLEYQVACENEESTLCSTSKETFFETTLLTLHHNQSAQQERKEKVIFDSLEEISSLLAYSLQYINSSSQYISQVNASRENKTSLSLEINSLLAKEAILSQRFSSILLVWDDGLFESIDDSSLLVLLSESKQLYHQSQQIENKTLEFLYLYQEYIRVLNELSTHEEQLLYLQEYYVQQNVSSLVDAILDQIYVEVNLFQTTRMSLESIYGLQKQVNDSITTYDSFVSLAINTSVNVTKNFYEGNISSIPDVCIALNASLQNISLHNDRTNETLHTTYSFLLSNATFLSHRENYSLAVYQNKVYADTTYPYFLLAPYHKNWSADINYLQSLYCFERKNASLLIPFINFTIKKSTPPVYKKEIVPFTPLTCVYGECNVVNDTSHSYPIILVHGHALNKRTSVQESLHSFSLFQNKLESLGILNAGELSDYTTTSWKDSSIPLSLRTSYYYLSYIDVGQFHLLTQKAQSIENYAIRLKEIVEEVKERTNQDKVIIIAHSMGGLVTRQYLSLFGEESVEKVILIGTPNNGIVGSTSKYCSVVGAKNECDEMTQGSVFLKRLNQYIPQIPLYVIAGVGCDMGEWEGDGVVTVDSVLLDYANNTIINGTCTDAFGSEMHSDLLNPAKYPQVFDLVEDILTS